MIGNDWSMIIFDLLSYAISTDEHPSSEFDREACDGNCSDIRHRAVIVHLIELFSTAFN